MTDKNTPKSFIEWLGYTTHPDFKKARSLGATIGGVAVLTISGALILSIVQFFLAAAGISTSETIHADARNYALILAALLSIPFVIWRVLIAQKQADIAEQSHMTDRITKAVEQLGAEKTIVENGNQETVPNLEVRLGAIYALERIAQDSQRDHISVMEILCAYVRHNAPKANCFDIRITENTEPLNATQSTQISRIPTPPIDIQAIMTVIGRRKQSRIDFEWDATQNTIQRRYQLDLRDANLQAIDLSRWSFDHVNFSNSNLQGADISGTRIRGANLRGAKFQGADFTSAKLQGTNLSFAKLQCSKLESIAADIHTNFKSARLQLASVRNSSFLTVNSLSETHINSMFGDTSTIRPAHTKKPDWAEKTLNGKEYEAAWRAAKAAAKL